MMDLLINTINYATCTTDYYENITLHIKSKNTLIWFG